MPLGSHALPVSSYGAFSKTEVVKTIGPNLPARLGPHVLPLSSLAESDTDLSVSVSGAQGVFFPGVVGFDTPTGVRALTPLVLSRPEPVFLPKSVGDQDASIIGAEIRASGEEMEGANVVIYLDGTEAIAQFSEPSSVFQGFLPGIVNNDATTQVQANFEIDDRTGFRNYPRWDRLSKLREEWTGYLTTDPDIRNPQDHVKARGSDPQRGPDFPEPDDNFISSITDPDDI